MRILIIDDWRDTAESLKVAMKLMGHDTVAAVTPEEALQLMRDEHEHDSCFDAIVVDYILPGTDGVSLIRLMREICCDPGAPIILTSAVDADEAYRLRKVLSTYPNTEFVRKPFSPPELEEAIYKLAPHQRVPNV